MHGGTGKNESFESYLERKEARRINGKLKGAFNSKRYSLKRTPLKKVSPKQKERLKKYKAATKEHYADESNQSCYLCGATTGLSIHHISKRGGNIDKNLVTLCMTSDFMNQTNPDSNHSHTGGCHGWVEANKSLARKMGLL
jgi:hypothetical protein